MKKFSSRKLFKVLIVVTIFGLLIFFNPRGFFNPIGIGFRKMTYPFEKISYSISHKVKEWNGFIFSISDMKKENAELLKEKHELLSENARLHDIERENIFLRGQVDILPREKFNLQAAYIISQDPQGLGNSIEINKGKKDGVENGMSVIVSNGIMIGKVDKSFNDKSLITLLTNPKSAVSVIVSQSGAKGLVRGEYGLGIIADSILQTDAVSVGNEIVTSGVGSEVPGGLLVGIVQEIRSSEDHLFRQAVVSSPVNVSNLEIVFVVRGVK